uniref:Uncharacterized protein n=1 Tax=Cacopsylla melanoneura TaxID=428564 RepID=A0A8D8M1Y2_9HEMI
MYSFHSFSCVDVSMCVIQSFLYTSISVVRNEIRFRAKQIIDFHFNMFVVKMFVNISHRMHLVMFQHLIVKFQNFIRITQGFGWIRFNQLHLNLFPVICLDGGFVCERQVLWVFLFQTGSRWFLKDMLHKTINMIVNHEVCIFFFYLICFFD